MALPDDVLIELLEEPATEDGRACYRAIANDVRLVTTEPRFTGGRRGFNDVYFWIAEAPTDNPTDLNGDADMGRARLI